jgi:hypothetical protein
VLRLEAPFHPHLDEQLATSRAYLRAQTARVFAAELKDRGGEATDLLASIDVLCSFETYQLLRTDQGVSSDAMRRLLITAIGALLRPVEGEGSHTADEHRDVDQLAHRQADRTPSLVRNEE